MIIDVLYDKAPQIFQEFYTEQLNQIFGCSRGSKTSSNLARSKRGISKQSVDRCRSFGVVLPGYDQGIDIKFLHRYICNRYGSQTVTFVLCFYVKGLLSKLLFWNRPQA